MGKNISKVKYVENRKGGFRNEKDNIPNSFGNINYHFRF